MSDFRLVKLVDPIQLYISGTFTPRGAYSAGTDYAVGDMVSYNGSSYIMYVDAVAGTVPTDATKWGVVASKGDTGATGNTGATGSPGANGSNGSNGANGADGQGVPIGGTTGQVLKKASNADHDTVWGTDNTGGGGGGDVATDVVWDAKGDLAVGTGADTADNLTVGANDTFLIADSATATGLKWAAAATARTALGLGTAATQASSAFDAAGAASAAEANAIAASQPVDGDLTTFGGLTPSNDDFLQRKAGAWANRTVAQVKTDLSLAGSNTGDQTITLTGDVTGSGAGSFATTIGNDKVTAAMLADQDLKDVAGITRNRGDLIVGGASAWVDLATGTAGQFLGTDGTDPIWREGGRSIYSATAVTTVSNTVTSTTLLNNTPLTLAANYMRVGDVYLITAAGTITNNTGSNQTITFNFGPAAALTTGNIATGATSRLWALNMTMTIRALGVALSGVEVLSGSFAISAIGGATGWDNVSATGYDYIISQVNSWATTSSQTFDFKAQLSAASGSLSIACQSFAIAQLPRWA